MREIKFRVWDSNINMMLDVGEIHFCKGGLLVYGNGVTLGNNCPNDEKIILLQYTGLKDKNGKEIYEGDILDTSNDGLDGCDVWSFGEYKLKVITWSDNYHGWIDLPDKNEDNSVFSQQYIEIIGNIHENPELLESEK